MVVNAALKVTGVTLLLNLPTLISILLWLTR